MFAFKIAYDGKMFVGSARQPGQKTVEGTLIEGLKKLGAMDDAAEATFKSSSRTDRGVSALGNVFAFDSRMGGAEVVQAMNGTGSQDGVWFLGWAKVPDDFRPRHASSRWYRYVLPIAVEKRLDLVTMRKAARLFAGTHDFACFCKDDKSMTEPRSTIRRIDNIEVHMMALALGPVDAMEKGKWTGHEGLHPGRFDLVIVDIKGKSFLWQMVRRVVAAMAAVSQGRLTLEDITAALEGERREFGVLPSEGLTLMDISYDFDFVPAERTQHLRSALEEEVLWDLARDMVFHQHLQKRLMQ